MFTCPSILSVTMLRPFRLFKLAEFVLHCGIWLRGMSSCCYNPSLTTTILTSGLTKGTMISVVSGVAER